jgi:hypothetical protein
MSGSRLDLNDQELAAAMASASEEQRATVATMALGAAFTQARMTQPFVRRTADGSLGPFDRAQLETQQTQAETAYLQLHEKFQTSEGLGDEREEDRHLVLFAQARALQAALYFDDGDFEEAVYEALRAWTDEEESSALTRRLVQAAS